MASRQGGMALFAVLWVLALLALIASSIVIETQTTGHLARNAVETARAEAAAGAGIQRAALALSEPAAWANGNATSASFSWQFDGADIQISIEDETGKIDLNMAPETLIASLFVQLGVDAGKGAALAAAIVEHRGVDPLGLAATPTRGLASMPDQRGQRFENVEELRRLSGMTAELYRRAAPSLTVYSHRASVDSAVASADVMRALRVAPASQTPSAGPPGNTQQPLVAKIGQAFTVRSEADLPSGANSVVVAVLLLTGDPDKPYAVYDWRRGDRDEPPP